MAQRCCGLARESAFCPDCGRKLTEKTPLMRLLTYIRNGVKARERNAKKASEIAEVPSQTAWAVKKYRQRAETCERDAQTWRSWADALAALLEAQAAEAPTGEQS
jgi:hypothetical protein